MGSGRRLSASLQNFVTSVKIKTTGDLKLNSSPVKETDQSLPRVDSSVLLMHRDPSDPESLNLAWIISKNPPPGTSIFICPILTLPLLFLGLIHVGTFLSPAIYCFIKKQRARQGFCIDRGRRGAGCLQLLNLLFYLLKQKESLHRHSMLVFIFFNVFFPIYFLADRTRGTFLLVVMKAWLVQE